MACMSSALGAFLAGQVACVHPTQINYAIATCTHLDSSLAHLTRRHELKGHIWLLYISDSVSFQQHTNLQHERCHIHTVRCSRGLAQGQEEGGGGWLGM